MDSAQRAGRNISIKAINNMKRVTVWNVETGESVDVDGVDAKEYCSTGGWSMTPVDTSFTDTSATKRSIKKKPMDNMSNGDNI